MRVLVVDRTPPCDLRQGNSLIGWHVFQRLALRHDLHLVCPAPPERIDEVHDSLSSIFHDMTLIPRQRLVPYLGGFVEAAAARHRLLAAGGYDAQATYALDCAVQDLIRSGSFDVVHTRQLPMAAVTGGIEHPAHLLELVDSETLQTRRRLSWRAPKSWLRHAAARTLERRAVRGFDVVTTVAQADADTIRRYTDAPVSVIPNGVDADFFAPLDVQEHSEMLLFFGAMGFAPNVSAVLHMQREILPLIRREIPSAQFVICGRDPSPAVQALAELDGTIVTGGVDDIREWIARAAVVVCPVLMGSGIKNKVLEALAMQRAVVTTPLGVEALEAIDGRDLRVAGTAQQFASTVVELLGDPAARSRLGEAGRALVQRRYTWEACAESYDEIYRELTVGTALRQPELTLAAG